MPENTFAAFDHALARGFAAIELDTQVRVRRIRFVVLEALARCTFTRTVQPYVEPKSTSRD